MTTEDAKLTQQERTKKSIDNIMDLVNIMGSDKAVVEGILESLQGTHRTLQQNFWRVMIQIMKQYSEWRSDLRNEGSVTFCKAVKEMLEKNPEKEYLPYV